MCKEVVLSKQTCHDYLARDVNYMLEYFQENAKLTYHTKLLQQKLKNIRKDDTNKMFWSDIAPRLMKIIYEQLVAEAELMVAGIKKAEEIIGSTTSKRQNESAIETRSKK
jgi:RIO-like serine/threonine protein kinase